MRLLVAMLALALALAPALAAHVTGVPVPRRRVVRVLMDILPGRVLLLRGALGQGESPRHAGERAAEKSSSQGACELAPGASCVTERLSQKIELIAFQSHDPSSR